jgi:hypothetical protein
MKLMNRKIWSKLLIAGICASLAYAQDEKAPDKAKPAEKKLDPAEAKKEEPKAGDKGKADAKAEGKDKKPAAVDMDSWMKLAAPGEHHKKLDVLAGTWNLSIKYPQEDGGESKGTAEFKWAMDGRFLVETSRSDMGGMTFEWMGWHGYDNQKKQYVSAWVDNFGTGIDTMIGQYDDGKKTLTYTGEVDDPATGGKQMVKWIMTLETKNKFTTRMIEGVGNGKEKTVMEITATRG